ncbi:hypothetical protein F5Y14DRAFT_465095 [Nemania sp. NC0429]|nr:hypothetical protein F5Y14DRAFT_465095 [Nemania sp. NC0429]
MTEDVLHLQFRYLLSRFGEFVPRQLPNTLLSSPHYNQPIIANNFSYGTLVNVARLRIIWVDSISLHLDLDQQSATLKLFRYPSFCAMLALPRASKSNILTRIFQPDLSDSESTLALEIDAPYSQNFFLEVLCSFRLIFSQHRSARRLFKKNFPSNTRGGEKVDPLLDSICGGEPQNIEVYEEICAFPEKAIYSSLADFPFLAHRLLILQNFVNIQSPNDLRSMWNDTRDLNRFYTFWAVIVVGGTSIFLAVVQIVVAGFQIYTA